MDQSTIDAKIEHYTDLMKKAQVALSNAQRSLLAAEGALHVLQELKNESKEG